jgi:hypothetical protein
MMRVAKTTQPLVNTEARIKSKMRACLMGKPHILSAGKHKRLEKSQFVEDFGDVGYGVGSVSV